MSLSIELSKSKKIDVDYVAERLNAASLVMLALPNKGIRPASLSAQSYGYVAPTPKDAMPSEQRARLPAPKPCDIDQADQALAWLSKISNPVTRKIVAMRSLTRPSTGTHKFSWRAVSETVKADVRAVKRWHSNGLAEIVQHLSTIG